MNKLLMTAALLMIVAAPAAMAQDAEREGKRCNKEDRKAKAEAHFEEMDADDSGTLSKDEVQGKLADHFDEIDADGDGELTKEELKAAREARKAKRGEGKGRRGPRGKGRGRGQGQGGNA